MDNMLEKFYTDFSDRCSEILEANEKAQKVYGALLSQRNSVKSKVLFDLLSSEIIAYNEMNSAFNKYMAVQAAYTTKYVDRIEHTLSLDVNADIKQHETMYALNNLLPTNNSFDLYLHAVSRGAADWSKIGQMLIELGIDITIGNISVIANIKALVDAAIQINNIVNAYTDDGTDYSDIDQELSKVEIHIEIMKNATRLFLYQAEVLGDASGDNTTKTE